MSLQQSKADISKSLKNYINSNMESWIKQTILLDMVSFARAANMPTAFINSIQLIKSGTKFKIVNDWRGKNKEPLAKFFEYGTKDHFIKPRNVKALHWTINTGSGASLQLDVISGDGFSKGHKVRGIKPFLPMTRGYEKGSTKLRQLILQKTKQFSKSLEQHHKIKVKL